MPRACAWPVCIVCLVLFVRYRRFQELHEIKSTPLPRFYLIATYLSEKELKVHRSKKTMTVVKGALFLGASAAL